MFFVSMTKPIIWHSNNLILSEPENCYSRNASCTLNWTSTFVYWTVLVVKHITKALLQVCQIFHKMFYIFLYIYLTLCSQ